MLRGFGRGSGLYHSVVMSQIGVGTYTVEVFVTRVKSPDWKKLCLIILVCWKDKVNRKELRDVQIIE